MERGRGWRTTVTPDLTAFLADLEMFYLQPPRQVSIFVARENPSCGNISRARLEPNLRSICACAGDTLMVNASLRAIRPVEGALTTGVG
jgi:hypothetical protein